MCIGLGLREFPLMTNRLIAYTTRDQWSTKRESSKALDSFSQLDSQFKQTHAATVYCMAPELELAKLSSILSGGNELQRQINMQEF